MVGTQRLKLVGLKGVDLKRNKIAGPPSTKIQLERDSERRVSTQPGIAWVVSVLNDVVWRFSTNTTPMKDFMGYPGQCIRDFMNSSR
ncbi:MAG: hypothetical protein ACYC7D_05055 [Nitrososphaerales archaeon]